MWKGSVKERKTCTVDMCIQLEEAKDKNQPTPNRKPIAKALVENNWQYKTHTIQISSNKRYASIEFKRIKDMEDFCINGLSFEGFNTNIFCKPDFKQRPAERKYLNVSFLNVPAEADQNEMRRFVEQHFTVVGQPYYPNEYYDGFSYYTGTRVYNCKKQVIESKIKMFGRYVKVIYDGQLGATDINNDNREDELISEINKNQPNTPQPNNTTEQKTVEEQQTTDPDKTSKPTDVHTPIVTKSIKNLNQQQANIIENQKKQTILTSQPEIVTATEQSPTTVPEIPAAELEEEEITDDEDMMSPAVILKILFAAPVIEPNAVINEATRFCVELHRNSFCDPGKVQRIPLVKRGKIIVKVMPLELGHMTHPMHLLRITRTIRL